METLIETIGFVASSISTKSSLSATSPLHGGGIFGGAGTGVTTHTDPTDILSIRIRPSTPGYGYEYDNYGYGYGASGYGYRYGYLFGSYYGSYYSGTNYENDDESAVRNVLAEYTVAWNGHDTATFGHLFTEDCDYVNIAGVHWKGVQEIVQRQAELFQDRLKTSVRTLTGVEVRFSAPDVALVHATWDVTGRSRPTGEAVPVLKEITTITLVKTNGNWLITSLQSTKSGGSTK
jgi:uncharacterized protein (TIGR02246 family)